MNYIKGLDTLRAFAVLFVIITHWWLPIDINDSTATLCFWIRGLVPDGGFGVNLFFVLSGFLITSILLEALKNDRQHPFKIIGNFIVRRALRIFPIYYLTLFVLVTIHYPFIYDNLIWFLTYTANILVSKNQSFNSFSHTWTLSVEEQFYLLWPWLIVFTNDRYLKYVLTLSIAIGIGVAFYSMKIQENSYGFTFMWSCVQAFGIGGLYAYLREQQKLNYFNFIVNVLFPIALLVHFWWSFSADQGKAYNYCLITVNSILSIWLIHRVVVNKSVWIQKYVLENRVLNKIGQISYGLYLFHYPLTWVYDKYVQKFFDRSTQLGTILVDWKCNYPIRLLLLFIVALASFHLFEKPIMKLKRHFDY